jgi:hypothetical protein
VAAALRWVRPDLTAELADHVLEEASAAGEQDRWLAAAGWPCTHPRAGHSAEAILCITSAGVAHCAYDVTARSRWWRLDAGVAVPIRCTTMPRR